MNLFLFSLCIVGIIGSFAQSQPLNESNVLNYRLSTDIEPLDYVIDVTPYFDNSTSGKEKFDGICTITLKTNKANVDTITLHKVNLNITEESLAKQASFRQIVENVDIKSHEYDAQTEKYTLKLATTLVRNELYVLNFSYIGSLGKENGFQRMVYKAGNGTK